MRGYPQTAQKCFAGNTEGGTTAVMYEGCLCASGGYNRVKIVLDQNVFSTFLLPVLLKESGTFS